MASAARGPGARSRRLPCAQELPAAVKSKLVCVGQPGVRAKQRLEANVGKCTSQARDPLAAQMEVGGMVHNCPVYGGSSSPFAFSLFRTRIYAMLIELRQALISYELVPG